MSGMPHSVSLTKTHRTIYSHSRKRLREEPQTYVNHRTLYFDDGNVILSCGSTIFRVHRSLLSKHSSVFRERFQPPQEDVKPKLLHGLPLIILDDTSEEMEALLNTIYDGL